MAMFFNPGVEAAQLRAQLAMRSSAPSSVHAAAAPVPSMTLGAASAAGADQAAAGADGVAAEAPNPKKIILSSVIRGAVSGASMMFGLNSFGPKVPFINNFMTKVITKIPLVAKLGWPMGTLGALGVGAAMGALFGLISGVRKARTEAMNFMKGQEQAMAAQGQQAGAVGDPLVLGPDGKPVAVDPATNRPVRSPKKKHVNAKKNPKMGADYKGVRGHSRHARPDGSSYHIQRGDTLWELSRRYDVSITDIVRANAAKIHNPNLIYAGDTIVIPDAGEARAARRRARRAS